MGLFNRQRIPTHQLTTGAQVRINRGEMGVGSPSEIFSSIPGPSNVPIYQYHAGDVFLPGTGNMVFEPTLDTPLFTIWGMGFIRNPNTFKVTQPPQIYSNQRLQNNGIGGLQLGQFDLTGLSVQNGTSD